MEIEAVSESASDAASTVDSVSFRRVSAVASQWMSDFIFVSVCRIFKERRVDDINDALTTYTAITSSPALKGVPQNEKTMICAFLSRVMFGKNLDYHFEEDYRVMPLMSAAKIWSSLEDAVADQSLFKNISILLVVQAVAVCLNEGEKISASYALKWLGDNLEFPQNLSEKLSRIVADRDTDHQLLLNFNFNCLLEKVQTFLDAYLEKNPSDFILKAATKMVQSSENNEDLEDEGTWESSLSDTHNKPTQNKTKRKLMSTKITDAWKPDSCKKPCFSLTRIPTKELSIVKSEKSVETTVVYKRRKAAQKWNPQLDKYLVDGVKRYGVGKWTRILMDFDFEGRTTTMLKDRWRNLLKSHLV